MVRDRMTATDPARQLSTEVSGTKPHTLLMLDSGTFRHVIGKNARHLLANVREITPVPAARPVLNFCHVRVK